MTANPGCCRRLNYEMRYVSKERLLPEMVGVSQLVPATPGMGMRLQTTMKFELSADTSGYALPVAFQRFLGGNFFLKQHGYVF
jgi:hypothetical protein